MLNLTLKIKIQVLVSALIYLFLATSLNAQTPKLTANSAWDTIEQSKNVVIIDSLSVNRFEAALIPGLADLIAEHDLVVSVKATSPGEFKLDNSWINLALKGGTRTLSNFTAIPNENAAYGPAFGTFDQLAEESDSGIRGTKLLWNIISLAESNRFIDLKTEFSWSSLQSSNKNKILARLTRIYPGTLKQGSTVAMREKFEAIEPEWLSPFVFLTIRQYGTNEDLLWFLSPTLNSVRELLGSLRGDNLLESLISLDDLDIFSGKPEMLEARFLSNFKTLVPFVSKAPITSSRTETEQECQNFTNPEQPNINPLSDFFLAPRDVFALELKQRDPFSLQGRQILYVDKATQLPFFKEVYAQNGKLIKSIFGAFIPIKLESSSQTHFLIHSVISFGKSEQMSSMKTLSGRICSQLPNDFSKKAFDPSELQASSNKTKPKSEQTETLNAKPQKSASVPSKTQGAH